ncbi:MAG: hypothetical protein WDZ56_01815 [Candidatus Paceibacterota bacterium]
MDTKDIIKATESTRRLVQDDTYYRFIFKKTEKVVSVIFYVSNNIETSKKTERVMEDILETAQGVHNSVIATLSVRAHLSEETLRDFAHSLIALDSKLRVATTLRLVSEEVLHVLVTEIDGILRGLNKYLINTTAFDDLDYKVASDAPQAVNRPKPREQKEREGRGEPETTSAGSDLDRRERIKVVLSAKGEATIKDIGDIISDVSSKTIQRELNAMIGDNLVKRQGERRWSKYSLI